MKTNDGAGGSLLLDAMVALLVASIALSAIMGCASSILRSTGTFYAGMLEWIDDAE